MAFMSVYYRTLKNYIMTTGTSRLGTYRISALSPQVAQQSWGPENLKRSWQMGPGYSMAPSQKKQVESLGLIQANGKTPFKKYVYVNR